MKLGWINLQGQCVIIINGKAYELRGFLFEIDCPKNMHFIII
jgi:hypothetical protein